MTNLGQVCLFLNLIKLVFSGVGSGLVSSEHLFFFYWFQGRNLLVSYQNFKRRGDIKKREVQMSREGVFFITQSKLMSHFVPVIPVSRETTLKKRYLG